MTTADTCPSCYANHQEIDAAWACPKHGHQLTYAGPNGPFDRYTCPAHRCAFERSAHPHTRTQQETPVTIHTEPAPTTDTAGALAIRGSQDFWDDKQLAALRQLGIQDAPNADLAVFMHYCQRTGLDPFSRHVTMIKRRERRGDDYVDKWTIQTEIDGLRVIARRAAARDRKIVSYGDTIWYDSDGKKYPIWTSETPPAGAQVTVYVDGAPFPGVARFKSFAAIHPKTGKLMGLWDTMPDHMIGKCAEAQALRKAFPHDLAGAVTTDEASRDSITPEQMAWNEHAPAIQPKRPRARRQAPAESGVAVIHQHWDRLGVAEDDERLNLTAALAGTDTVLDSVADLPPYEQLHAAQMLAGCDDIGQVHALIQRGDAPGGEGTP